MCLNSCGFPLVQQAPFLPFHSIKWEINRISIPFIYHLVILLPSQENLLKELSTVSNFNSHSLSTQSNLASLSPKTIGIKIINDLPAAKLNGNFCLPTFNVSVAISIPDHSPFWNILLSCVSPTFHNPLCWFLLLYFNFNHWIFSELHSGSFCL